MAATGDQTREKRRRPWRFAFRSVLGIAALCTGALAVLLLFLPRLLSPVAASFVEDYLEERHQGQFDVEGVKLAWFGRQSLEALRIYAPDGEEIGEFSASAPPLVDLIRGGGRNLGTITVKAHMALAVDDTGVSNLERALAPAPREESAERRHGEGGQRHSRPRPQIAVQVEFECDELSFSDQHTRESGTPFVLRDLRGRAQLAPGEPLALTLDGTVVAAEPGVLRARARIDDPFRITDEYDPTPFHVDCEVSGLPTALVDALAGQSGRLTHMLGPDFKLTATGTGTSAAGTLSLALESDHLQLAFAGRVDGGELSMDQTAGVPARLALDLGPEWVDEMTASMLATTPEGTPDAAAAPSLFPRPAQRLEVELEELALPLAPLFTPSDEPGELVRALLRGTTARARLTAGDWTYRASDLKRLQLLDVVGEARIEAGDEGGAKPFEIALRTTLVGQATSEALPPNVELTVAGPDLSMVLGWLPGEALAPVHVSGVARELDTAMLDAWIGPESNLRSAQGSAISCDLTFDLVQESGSALETTFDVGFASEIGQTRASGSAEVADVRGCSLAGPWPELALTAQLDGLAPLLALLPEAPHDPRQVLGDRVELSARHEGRAPSSGTIELRLVGEGIACALSGAIEDGVLRIERGGELTASIVPPPEVVASLLEPHMPADAELVLAHDERIELECSELVADLTPWLAAEPDAEPPSLATLAASLEGQLEVRLPTLTFTPPPLGTTAASSETEREQLEQRIVGLIEAQKRKIVLRDLALAAAFAADEPARAHLSGVIAEEPPGEVDLEVTLPDLPVALAQGATPQVEIAGKLTSLATSVVDALAHQNGLLVDTLGPTLDLALSAAWPLTADREIVAHMRSSQAELDLKANLSDGVLLSGQDGKLDASAALTPLFTQRVVGNLLPMLVNLSKPEGAGPSVFQVRSFSVPLDGDVKKLSGQIRVDLGEVAYSLLPGLDSVVGKLGASAEQAAEARQVVRRADLPPFDLAVERGVVRVDELPLVMGGHKIPFTGRYDLAEKKYNLATELPLKLLGHGFEKKLDKVREYLDPDTKVPIEIKGSFGAPKVRLGEGFLDSILDSAAKRALEKGVSGLLDKLKGDG